MSTRTRAQNCLLILLVGALIDLILSDLFMYAVNTWLHTSLNYTQAFLIFSGLCGGIMILAGLALTKKK